MLATAEITMPISEWETLLDQLEVTPEKWPSYQFKNAIREVIRKAKSEFVERVQKP